GDAPAQRRIMIGRALEQRDLDTIIAGGLQILDDRQLLIGYEGRPEQQVEAELHSDTQLPDLPEAMMASQTRLVSSASRKVGAAAWPVRSPSRKSATWWVKECS